MRSPILFPHCILSPHRFFCVGVTAAGVMLFDPTQVNGIQGAGMTRIPEASAKFTTEAVAHFSISGCGGINSATMAGYGHPPFPPL